MVGIKRPTCENTRVDKRDVEEFKGKKKPGDTVRDEEDDANK